MPDPFQAMMGAALAGGNADPSAIGDYYKSQKQQLVAQMLLNNMQENAHERPGWYTMRQMPQMSPLHSIATALSGYLGGKALDKSYAAQQAYFQGLYGGGPQTQQAPQTQQVPANADPGTGVGTVLAPGAQQNDATQTVQAPQRQDPMDQIIPGTQATMRQATVAASYGNPVGIEYVKHGLATLGATSSMQGEFNTAHTPQPQRAAVAAALIGKGTSAPIRGGSSLYDYGTGQFTATAPQGGTMQTWDNGMPSQQRIPGADAAASQAAYSENLGKVASTPTIVTGSSGSPIATFPVKLPGAGSAPVGSTAPSRSTSPVSYAPPANHIMSPTEQETNKGLAAQVPDVMKEMNDKAQQATLGLASLSEMKNLAQGFNPGKAAPMLSALGNVAISLGMDPAQVKSMLNIEPGNVEAFEKQTAALASEVVKQMSNRVTQMEFKTYLANNPNALLTADGLKRVISYMEKGFNSTLDQQQEASQFLKENQQTPERLITDFPALYNRKKADQIKAKQFDSLSPSLSDLHTRNDVQRTAQGGSVAVPPTVKDADSFNAWRAQHPELKGKAVKFSDGSIGIL